MAEIDCEHFPSPEFVTHWLDEATRKLGLVLQHCPALMTSEREKLQEAREIVLHLKALEEER